MGIQQTLGGLMGGLRWMMLNQTLLQRRQTLGLNLLLSSPNTLRHLTACVIEITWASTIDWIPKKMPGQEEIGSGNRRQSLAVQTLFELLSNSVFTASQFVCKRLPARSVADMFCWLFSPTLGHVCFRRCANESADSSPFESDIAKFGLHWRNTWQGCQEGHRGWFAVLILAQFDATGFSEGLRRKHPIPCDEYPIWSHPSSSHSGFSHDSSEGPLRPNSEARDGAARLRKEFGTGLIWFKMV